MEPIKIEQGLVSEQLIIAANKYGQVFIKQYKDVILITPESIPAVMQALGEISGKNQVKDLGELLNRIIQTPDDADLEKEVYEILKDYIIIKK